MGYEIGASFMHKESIILTQHLTLRGKKYENKVLYDNVLRAWTYPVGIREWPENSWGELKIDDLKEGVWNNYD